MIVFKKSLHILKIISIIIITQTFASTYVTL